MRVYIFLGLIAMIAACDSGDLEQGSVGPAGPRGEVGPMGLRGETGPAGAMGPAGPPGAPGRDGQDGQDGQDGRDLREATLVGFSKQTARGNDGLLTLSAACAVEFPGARICASDEIKRLDSALPAGEVGAWVTPAWQGIVQGHAFDASGLRALIPEYFTCQGWGGDPALPSGTLRPPTGLSLSPRGQFALTECTTALRVSCCVATRAK